VSQRDSEPSPPDGGERVVSIARATLRGVDFRKARFDRFSLAGALFLSCDFRGLRLDKRYQPMFSASPRSVFRDCRFEGADLRRIHPDQARFERCTFDDALIDGWKCETAEFVDCRFAGPLGTVTFRGRPGSAAAKATMAERKQNEFSGNDLRDADLTNVTFAGGIELGRQRLPLDDDHIYLDRFPQRLSRAQAEVTRWDVQDERIAGLDMLRDLATRFAEQRDIFAPRLAKGGPPARVQTRVWALLERSVA
jgi:pentapeptide repeat protein